MAATQRPLVSRRTAWTLVAGAGTAAVGYLAYRYWLKEFVERRLNGASSAMGHAYKLLETAASVSELSSSALVDLRAFLESDSDEIPRSVRQLLKLSDSPEFQRAVLRTTQSAAEGLSRGWTSRNAGGGGEEHGSGLRPKGMIEVILEKLFTDEGKSFASAVSARIVRALVASVSSAQNANHAELSNPGATLRLQADKQLPWQLLLLDLLTSERGRVLVSEVVKAFAVSGVGAWVDRTSGANMYHDFLSGIRSHKELVKDLSSHIISHSMREALYTWQTAQRGPGCTKHEACSSSSSSFTSSPRAGNIPLSTFSDSDTEIPEIVVGRQQRSYAAEVSKYLAQPAIRQLILDVTAAATSKGMEAFLLVMMAKVFGVVSLPTLSDKGVADNCAATSLKGLGCENQQHSVGPTALHQPKTIYILDTKLLASRTLAVASVCLAVMLHYIS